MRMTTRWPAAAALAAVLLATAACDQPVDLPRATGGTSSSSAGAPATLTIPITIAGGQVSPNGQKITTSVGRPVVLQVTSDEADEIHAHIGDGGYELEVAAGTPTTGTFTPSSPGSFEIESHHLEKVIVILDVS